MRRKLLYYLCMLTFTAAVFIIHPAAVNEPRQNRPTGRSRAYKAGSTDGLSRYYLRFTLARFPVGKINCYIPKYEPTDPATARLYASLFNVSDEYEDSDEAYIYTGVEGKLSVYKNAQQLCYEAAANKAEADVSIQLTEQEVIEIAADFMETRFLFSPYEEARVQFDGECYTVSFVDRIGNLKNYAFNNTVVINRTGFVVQADYYFVQYERLNACTIKSMRDAYTELPQDLPEDCYVNLSGCQLIYIYENSIIQPAYFFEGEMSGGHTFEYFVNAAVYGA